MRWSGDGDVATEYEETLGISQVNGQFIGGEWVPSEFYERVRKIGLKRFIDAPYSYLLPEDEDQLDTLYGLLCGCAYAYPDDREDFNMLAGEALALMFSVMDAVTAEQEYEGRI